MSSSTIAPPRDGLADRLIQLRADIQALAACPPTSVPVADLGPLLVELESLQDQLAGIASGWLAEFEASAGPEEHGAPSLSVWSRRELRATPMETRRRTRRAAALAALPETRAALERGTIGLAHVDAIAIGVQQLGAEVVSAVEPVLLEVAARCDANAVRESVRKVRDTLDADAGFAAYVRSLERRDIRVTPVGDGFDVRGFLDAETGAKFKQVLDSLAKKTRVDDDRTSGHRRADGLDELCNSVLGHGLPTDRGLRPHLFVTVPADRLDAATQQHRPVGQPGALDGFGEISDQLLAKLACDCQLTVVLTDHGGHVLDVGRTSRLATLKQRQAIFVQQGGRCFNPGCDRTHLEIHHMVPWSVGGRTDMRDLRGYCTRCHHLIHLGLLVVTPDGEGGWGHQTKHRELLPQYERRAGNLTRVYLQALTHGGKQHALKVTQDYRRGRTILRT